MPHSVHSSRESSPVLKPDAVHSYWNNNICEKAWTRECPVYLTNLPEKSIRALSTRDEDFQIRTWQEVKHYVETNQINLFQRLPSHLRQYLQHMHELKKTHGSVMNFVQKTRLQWTSITPSGSPPFSNPADYKILYNDFPYGIDPQIVHLVVWTKFLLEDDGESGDLSVAARNSIEKFVAETFCGGDGVSRDQLVWFKNWKSLKSIHALEHFHVMLYKPSPEFLERITNGD